MFGLFSKPKAQITWEDVQELLAHGGAREDETTEFKETLSTKDGNDDRWIIDQSRIGEQARNEILEAVVAFANAEGGTLVLGIEESDDEPRRAMGICPIPRVHDLADRFAHAIRDCIEPKIPSAEVFGVDMPAGTTSEGILVVRVPSSRSAPHRLRPTLECYVRRRDNSEKMTMREIQDMTVLRWRSEELTRAKLDEERKSVERVPLPRESANTSRPYVTVRISAIPTRAILEIPNLETHDTEFPVCHNKWVSINSKIHEMSVRDAGSLPRLTPILRGAWRCTKHPDQYVTAQFLRSDGRVTLVFRSNAVHSDDLYLVQEELLAELVTVLDAADQMRKLAGTPGVEYAIEVEIMQSRLSAATSIALFEGNEYLVGPLRHMPVTFPVYSYCDSDECERCVHEFLNDLRNAAGKAALPDGAVKLNPTS